MAKTSAAEKAIKAIIVKKLIKKAAVAPVEEESDSKTEQEKQDEDLSWSQLGSFAIHKLFSSWDEDGSLMDTVSLIKN